MFSNLITAHLTFFQTVIADCCYASSITRDVTRPEANYRSVHFTTSIPKNLDHDILNDITSTGSQNVAEPQTFRGSSSHILISACRASERAYEINGHGAFTFALLHLLQQVCPTQLKYSTILDSNLFPPMYK